MGCLQVGGVTTLGSKKFRPGLKHPVSCHSFFNYNHLRYFNSIYVNKKDKTLNLHTHPPKKSRNTFFRYFPARYSVSLLPSPSW